MVLPVPVPGLVIRYSYLWRSEHAKGREEGTKWRPVVVVLCVVRSNQTQRVIVAPITHTDPGPERGIEMPRRVAHALGLDDERSWIITDDLNVFDWPGHDLAQIPGQPERFHYGHLPQRLFFRLRDAILSQRPPARPTPRT